MYSCVGTLLNKDTPIAEISVTDGGAYSIEFLSTDTSLYPYDLQRWPSALGLRRFIEARITPPTRQGLHKDLQKAGIERYSIPAILNYSNGRDCSDPFWIRFKEGPQTWKEVWAVVGMVKE